MLVWLDETGHELFTDKNYPLFGLGGCVVEARKYNQLVRKPWQKMKTLQFDTTKPLHASELHKPNEAQVQAIAHIFSTGQFRRIAAIVTDQTVFGTGIKPYKAAALCLLERLRNVSEDMYFSKIFLIIEQSQRADKYAEKYLTNHPFRRVFSGNEIDVQFSYFNMAKSACEPGLEIADFVMHAAGGHARSVLESSDRPKRRDFAVTFPSSKKHLHSYLQVTKIETNST